VAPDRRSDIPRRAAPAQAPPARGARARVLRIIAGEWRGRRLRFPAAAAIRPTPDRVRETLFNWIGERVRGARCLDLFAGSGALGLEALSRGAAYAEFIDTDSHAVQAIETLLKEWGARHASVRRIDAQRYLASAAAPFDIVFVDPPFGAGLIGTVARELQRGWLAQAALIYVESPAGEGLPELPPDWSVRRQKRAGEVGYHLLERAR
jgi:16S rRNA (guanine966-N2)-methyltransferase